MLAALGESAPYAADRVKRTRTALPAGLPYRDDLANDASGDDEGGDEQKPQANGIDHDEVVAVTPDAPHNAATPPEVPHAGDIMVMDQT